MRINNKCFGVDLGGTTTKIGLFNMDGTLIEKYEVPTNKKDDGIHILDDIKVFIDQVIVEKSLDSNDIIGIGLGVPGAVTDDGIVNKCINLGWNVINVESIMKEKTNFNVKVGNDANMAALGEYWKGGAAEFSSIALITIGTGIGGGIIMNGRPINGYNGAAGEIGHVSIVYDETETCNCGKKGCLEQVASASGIVRVAKKFLNATDTDSSLRGLEDISAKSVFDEAKKGDAVASEVVAYITKYLGLALANIAGVIDPECFVIGGGVSAAGQYLVDLIAASYRKNVFHPCKDTPIVLASLGNDAGMYGAAKLVIDASKNEE